METPVGFEPTIENLQSSALCPLGDGAINVDAPEKLDAKKTLFPTKGVFTQFQLIRRKSLATLYELFEQLYFAAFF